MSTQIDYTGLKPTWCPGCGNFGILTAVNKALVELKIEPHQVLMVSGIGQSGKLPHYSRGNVFNSLHGRPLPPAIGAKLANSELNVIAFSGDGDAYGEGGNHFIHSMRRNHNITYIVHDNQVYGLTKGQASPTSDQGYITNTTPYGAANPVHPLTLAIIMGASFVARGYSGDIEHLSSVIQQGIKHKGFSLIDVLQPCVSFNKKNTYAWYKERVYKIDENKNYNPLDKNMALEKAQEWGEKIPIGIIYKTDLPVYDDQFPILRKGTLVKQMIKSGQLQRLIEELL